MLSNCSSGTLVPYLLPFGAKGCICEILSREGEEPLAVEKTKGIDTWGDYTRQQLSFVSRL